MVAVISLNSQTFLGHNQATYQDLRAALQLNLRRQLLIAVCDDSSLQAQLSQRLVDDLSPYSATGQRSATVRPDQSPLVTLSLDSQHPDLVREVLLWLKQQRRLAGSPPMIPAFQMVGIEALTRQSPTIQNRFLASLIRVDALLTQLDCRLLVWVSRPWLGKIQQVVPGFWRSRSGLYEFVGEPTAAPPQPSPISPQAPTVVPDSTPAAASPLPTDVWSMLQEDLSSFELGLPGAMLLPIAPTDTTQPTDQALGLPEADLDSSRTAAPLSLQTASPAPGSPLPPIPTELAQDEPLVNLWHYIQFLQTQQAGPFTLARAHLALGQISRERLEAGLMALPVLNFTLEIYQRATAGLLEGENDWCDALNDLASLYWLRAQQETQPPQMEQWLRRSVNAYQRALEGQTSAAPATLGRIYSNLGNVYGLLAQGEDTLSNLGQAAQAYQRALQYISADTDPLDYANLQNSLGAIHWRLSHLEQPQHHLHQAIAAYTEALHYQLPQVAPQEYAMLQNNLGIAYWSLAQHERPTALLEQAIAAYQAALTYRTVAVAPAGCAATQNNLGTAYWDLAQQQTSQPDQRGITLAQSVAAYEAALDAVEQALQQSPPEAPGFDVWATCHSAGVVHDQLAQALPADQQREREGHLNAALGHYLLAYQGWQHSPQQLEVLAAALVYSVRLHFEILGMSGQQAILSKLPPDLLGRVLPKL